MDRSEHLEHLATDGAATADAAEEAPTAAVTACPGWTVADLTAHLGTIHRWAAAMVRTLSSERMSRRDLPAPPSPPDELVTWFRDGLRDLTATLAGADPSATLWTFGPDRTTGFWVRRMAQETAVHRWDAQAAAAPAGPAPIHPALAADGIDEMLEVFVAGRPAASGAAGRLRLRATDCEREWTLAFGDAGEATAVGTASDLLLFLWGRVPPSALDAAGSDELLARWQAEVRI